jgi:hypothetical protein
MTNEAGKSYQALWCGVQAHASSRGWLWAERPNVLIFRAKVKKGELYLECRWYWGPQLGCIGRATGSRRGGPWCR